MHQVSVRFLFCSLKFDWEGESCKGLEMRALESRTETGKAMAGRRERFTCHRGSKQLQNPEWYRPSVGTFRHGGN